MFNFGRCRGIFSVVIILFFYKTDDFLYICDISTELPMLQVTVCYHPSLLNSISTPPYLISTLSS